jgi:hypothetical protein
MFFCKTGLFTFVSVAVLALNSFAANSQTSQQDANQDVNVQGNDNEINQTINQYYFSNPGKGPVQRRDPVNSNERPQKPNNSEWGQTQGNERRNLNPN